MKKITLLERETIFNFNEAEQTASVYTYNKALLTKLSKLLKDHPQEVTLLKDFQDGGREYLIPKKWIRVCPPRRVNLTEEQRNKQSERMKKLNDAKKRKE